MSDKKTHKIAYLDVLKAVCGTSDFLYLDKNFYNNLVSSKEAYFLFEPPKKENKKLQKENNIYVNGLIVPKEDFYTSIGINTSLEGLERQIIEKMEHFDSLNLVFDTPGGSAFGLADFNKRLKSYAEKTPIYAIIPTSCLSAGYHLASACTKIKASADANVGSIGCISIMDVSKNPGEKVFVSDISPYKVFDGSKKVNDKAQEKVNKYGRDFVEIVSVNRGYTYEHVAEKFGQGLSIRADEVVEVGMIDEIINYSEVLGVDADVLVNKNSLLKENKKTTEGGLAMSEKEKTAEKVAIGYQGITYNTSEDFYNFAYKKGLKEGAALEFNRMKSIDECFASSSYDIVRADINKLKHSRGDITAKDIYFELGQKGKLIAFNGEANKQKAGSNTTLREAVSNTINSSPYVSSNGGLDPVKMQVQQIINDNIASDTNQLDKNTYEEFSGADPIEERGRKRGRDSKTLPVEPVGGNAR